AGWIVGSYMGKSGAFFDPKGPQRDPIERYLDGVVVYGTPEKVIDELQRLEEEMFLDYLLAAPLSHESLVLSRERVLPKLVGWSACERPADGRSRCGGRSIPAAVRSADRADPRSDPAGPRLAAAAPARGDHAVRNGRTARRARRRADGIGD